MRKNSKPKNSISKLFEDVLNEIFDKLIETNFEIIKTNPYYNILRFKTDNGYEYDLEIHFGSISQETRLFDGSKLSDYIKTNEGFIPCIDIGFTPTERDEEERKNPIVYTMNTNRNEHLELIGRLAYISSQIPRLYPNFKVFVIGHDTHPTKLKIYEKSLYNNFKNSHMFLYGESNYYDDGATYIIEK